MRDHPDIQKQNKFITALYSIALRDSPGDITQSTWYPILLEEYNKLDQLLTEHQTE